MEKYKVFVYGTLRSHEQNSHLLKDAVCIAEQCWTYGELYDTALGYPAVVLSKKGRIYGELYEVNHNQLKELDYLEGYTGVNDNDDYKRVEELIFSDLGEFRALLYIYSPEKALHLKRINSGDWKYHQYQNKQSQFYFAYGSCMDDERFKKANVDHLFKEMIGRGELVNYTLKYTCKLPDGGRADIVEGDGIVEGKVYEINQEALEYLIKREGVMQELYRPAFIDVKIGNTWYINVLTFIVVHKQAESAPPLVYATEIIRGAADTVSASYMEKIKSDLQLKFQLVI